MDCCGIGFSLFKWRVTSSVNSTVNEVTTHLTKDDQVKQKEDTFIDSVQKGMDSVLDAPKNWKEKKQKKKFEQHKKKYNEHTEHLREKYNIPKDGSKKKKKKSSGSWFS